MRKLLLASSACFLLSAGLALAQTTVTVPVVKNAASVGAGNSSATTGGEAASLNNVANKNNVGNKNNSDNSLSVFASLNNVGNRSLAITHTDTHIDVKLATSSNEGELNSPLFIISSPTGRRDGHDRSSSSSGSLTGSAEMHDVNGGSGISNAEQNTGIDSLQQNSVALSSVVSAGGNGTGISGF